MDDNKCYKPHKADALTQPFVFPSVTASQISKLGTRSLAFYYKQNHQVFIERNVFDSAFQVGRKASHDQIPYDHFHNKATWFSEAREGSQTSFGITGLAVIQNLPQTQEFGVFDPIK